MTLKSLPWTDKDEDVNMDQKSRTNECLAHSACESNLSVIFVFFYNKLLRLLLLAPCCVSVSLQLCLTLLGRPPDGDHP